MANKKKARKKPADAVKDDDRPRSGGDDDDDRAGSGDDDDRAGSDDDNGDDRAHS